MAHWQTRSFKTPHLRLYFTGLRTVKSVTLIFDEFTFGGSLDVLQMSLLCAHLETHWNIFTFKLRAWLTNQQANYISLQIYQYQRSCRSLSNKIYQYSGAATNNYFHYRLFWHSVHCHIIKRKAANKWPIIKRRLTRWQFAPYKIPSPTYIESRKGSLNVQYE